MNTSVIFHKRQMERGKYFLHEHPAYARIGQNQDVIMIMNRKDVRTVVGDMCAFGMAIEEDDETEDLFSVRATFAIPTVVCLRPAVNELGDLGKRVVVYVPLWSSSFTIEER